MMCPAPDHDRTIESLLREMYISDRIADAKKWRGKIESRRLRGHADNRKSKRKAVSLSRKRNR